MKQKLDEGYNVNVLVRQLVQGVLEQQYMGININELGYTMRNMQWSGGWAGNKLHGTATMKHAKNDPKTDVLADPMVVEVTIVENAGAPKKEHRMPSLREVRRSLTEAVSPSIDYYTWYIAEMLLGTRYPKAKVRDVKEASKKSKITGGQKGKDTMEFTVTIQPSEGMSKFYSGPVEYVCTIKNKSIAAAPTVTSQWWNGQRKSPMD